jgi:multidrug resistance efflux pump
VPPAREEAPESPADRADRAGRSGGKALQDADCPPPTKLASLRRRDRCAGCCSRCCRSRSIVGGYWYVTGGQVMSTDDAYVEADKVGVSTDVSGIVQEVDVTENQHVATGQVLYRLDPRQFQIALDNAKANLAQTALTIEAMKQDYKRMLSDAAAQQAQVDLDQLNYDRNAMLLHSATAAGGLRSGANTRSTTTRASSRPCASRRRCSSPSSAAIRYRW